MALLLSRYPMMAWHTTATPQAAISLQRAVQWPRHATNSSSDPVLTDPASTTSTSGRDVTAGTTELPKQRVIWPKLQSKFCRVCGGGMNIVQPEGDREWRHVCNSCGYIDYFNPKMVVGCVVQHDNKILLCRRGIEPCKGLWTIPAGFMEIGESSAAGAARETLEEANAAVQILGPYAHWDIPVIGQTVRLNPVTETVAVFPCGGCGERVAATQAYILFRAELAPPFTFSAGAESLEVALFEPHDIPFDEIAFSSVSITLRHFLEDMASGNWHLHHGVIHRKPDAAPNDPAAFELRDHFAVPVGATQTHAS